MEERLDKLAAQGGLLTRREARERIRAGQVTVDGQVCRRADARVDPGAQRVVMDGKRLGAVRPVLLMMNKPAGVVSATKDTREKTVLDLLKDAKRNDLFPVGRLDKDTVGLLLITNDGELAHRLLSPGRHVDKVYEAAIKGRVTGQDVDAFAAGVDIGDDKPCLPANLTILESGEISRVRIKIREGRYHQIKRMFQAVEKEVLFLKRLSMGNLKLDETLKEGEARPLTPEETERLKAL